MKILGPINLLLISTFSSAQHKQEAIDMRTFPNKQIFDIITYTLPTGWERVSYSNDVVSYAVADNQEGTYCMVSIYKSVDGTNSDSDFYRNWQILGNTFNVTVKPETETRSVTLENGWNLRSGVVLTDYNSQQHQMMIVSMSGNARVIYITILSNSQDYQINISNFLDSISLPKLETNSQQAPTKNKAPINDNASVIGTWGTNSGGGAQIYGDPVSYANSGYTQAQYTFNNNNTYSFYSKTYRSINNEILLVKENGTYQIIENKLVIDPKNSVIESWSKRNGTDEFGHQLSTQARPLEKVTYFFTKFYFSGIQEWNLVLQAEKPTQRDGPFNIGGEFSNAWYYQPISTSNPLISVPGGR